MVKRRDYGSRFLDYFVLLFSIISIIGGSAGFFIVSLVFHITNIRPYILLIIILSLGILGYRAWRRENVD